MAPSAIVDLIQEDDTTFSQTAVQCSASKGNSFYVNRDKKAEYLIDRNLHRAFPVAKGGQGNYIFLTDGRAIFDASTGAAVSCLGHGNKRIIQAVEAQLRTGLPYASSCFWGTSVTEELSQEIIRGTNGKMARVYLTGSGSEAIESAVKLARQFFYECDKNSPRINFITREGSYHGNTLGALSVSGHVARRAPYTPLLPTNTHHVSSCNPYRQRLDNESDKDFVSRKAAELEAKFQELGPETVIGFIAEPVVGAALGCVPSVPGYFQAMRDVCQKHGALLILDEVMSGMGRCGTLHAWQAEGVVPDIQTVAKGLGGGYQPIGAVLVSHKIVNRLIDGSGCFIHGQTYQGMPVQAAAALAVQQVLRENNLVENVAIQGTYLGERLKTVLANHPHVGDIRGRGLFWALEFVRDKKTKQPFDSKLQIAQRLAETSLTAPFNMTMYPAQGAAGGLEGDQILICPTYFVTKEDIDFIVQTTSAVVHHFFDAFADM